MSLGIVPKYSGHVMWFGLVFCQLLWQLSRLAWRHKNVKVTYLLFILEAFIAWDKLGPCLRAMCQLWNTNEMCNTHFWTKIPKNGQCVGPAGWRSALFARAGVALKALVQRGVWGREPLARAIAHSTERAAVAAAGFLRGGARLFQKPTVPKHSERHQQGMDP